jgi:hypothetical protein
MTTFFRMAVLGPRPLCAGAVLCLLLTVLVYAPGLHGPVIFDDMPNIFENGRMQAVDGFDGRKIAAATWSGDAGPLKRPVSMLTFALNYAATGADVFYFKVTNLAVHLITGLSLGYLTWLLLGAYRERQRPDLSPVRQAWLSLLVAAAWLLHPLNLSPVLHVVQRMTSLCALFTVWGLIFYLLGRERLTRHGRSLAGWSMIGFGLFGFGALAALSKENGALLPFFMILIEALLFDFHCRIRLVLPRRVSAKRFVGRLCQPAVYLARTRADRGSRLVVLPENAAVARYPRDGRVSRRFLHFGRLVVAVADAASLARLAADDSAGSAGTA